MFVRKLIFFAFLTASIVLALPALALPIVLSTASSDETPAADLDATFDFGVAGSTLTLVVTNTTTAPNEFNINEIFFNASNDVTSLSLTSAMHSAEGNVMMDWGPLDTSVMVDGFDTFDFGLTDGMGETHPSVIGPTEFITFMFSITGTSPFNVDDFNQPNSSGYTAAAKFVNGPGDDSAWGAVPEPSTALLVATGLLVLGVRQKARRNG
jgi:hypothetical protein